MATDEYMTKMKDAILNGNTTKISNLLREDLPNQKQINEIVDRIIESNPEKQHEIYETFLTAGNGMPETMQSEMKNAVYIRNLNNVFNTPGYTDEGIQQTIEFVKSVCNISSASPDAVKCSSSLILMKYDTSYEKKYNELLKETLDYADYSQDLVVAIAASPNIEPNDKRTKVLDLVSKDSANQKDMMELIKIASKPSDIISMVISSLQIKPDSEGKIDPSIKLEELGNKSLTQIANDVTYNIIEAVTNNRNSKNQIDPLKKLDELGGKSLAQIAIDCGSTQALQSIIVKGQIMQRPQEAADLLIYLANSAKGSRGLPEGKDGFIEMADMIMDTAKISPRTPNSKNENALDVIGENMGVSGQKHNYFYDYLNAKALGDKNKISEINILKSITELGKVVQYAIEFNKIHAGLEADIAKKFKKQQDTKDKVKVINKKFKDALSNIYTAHKELHEENKAEVRKNIKEVSKELKEFKKLETETKDLESKLASQLNSASVRFARFKKAMVGTFYGKNSTKYEKAQDKVFQKEEENFNNMSAGKKTEVETTKASLDKKTNELETKSQTVSRKAKDSSITAAKTVEGEFSNMKKAQREADSVRKTFALKRTMRNTLGFEGVGRQTTEMMSDKMYEQAVGNIRRADRAEDMDKSAQRKASRTEATAKKTDARSFAGVRNKGGQSIG